MLVYTDMMCKKVQDANMPYQLILLKQLICFTKSQSN